ncbi:MAG: lipase family protein [Planctomycetaceae bacterium]|nr:lipase family protein [Planctomycetaceae bacterium]
MIGFEPHARDFSVANAIWLARCAKLSYESDNLINAELSKWGMSAECFESSINMQAFIASDESKVIVAFRGTESTQITDWLIDLDTRKSNSNLAAEAGSLGIWFDVHNGFFDGISSLWIDMADRITAAAEAEKPVWLTGHSLGAALAMLAAAKRLEDQLPVSGVYTFGSPRVGGAAFYSEMKKHHPFPNYRFVNHRDAVTRIPAFVSGYMHQGQVMYFDGQGGFHPNYDPYRPIIDFFVDLTARFRATFAGSIQDHSMSKYLELVEAAGADTIKQLGIPAWL